MQNRIIRFVFFSSMRYFVHRLNIGKLFLYKRARSNLLAVNQKNFIFIHLFKYLFEVVIIFGVFKFAWNCYIPHCMQSKSWNWRIMTDVIGTGGLQVNMDSTVSMVCNLQNNAPTLNIDTIHTAKNDSSSWSQIYD